MPPVKSLAEVTTVMMATRPVTTQGRGFGYGNGEDEEGATTSQGAEHIPSNTQETRTKSR